MFIHSRRGAPIRVARFLAFRLLAKIAPFTAASAIWTSASRVQQREGIRLRSPRYRIYSAVSVVFISSCLVVRAVSTLAGTVPNTVRTISLPVAVRDDIHFKHLSTEQGLSQSTVHAITQDDQGFMWFGTHVGLNRFDGYTVKIYKHEVGNSNSLGGTFVSALFKDRDGMLWVGVDQALDKFDPATETFTHFQRAESGTGLSGSVSSISQDQQGFLWLATSEGLDKLDPASGRFLHYRHDPSASGSLASDDVRAVFVDRTGALWAVTAGGIDVLRPGQSEFDHYGSFQLTLPARDEANVGICEDRAGTIWLNSAMGSGLASFDRQSGTVTLYKFQDNERENSRLAGVNALMEDRDGMLWIGTVGSGLVKFDRKTGSVTRYRNDPSNPESLSNNFEDAFYQDREGNIWLGNGGGGVERYSPAPSPFIRYRHEGSRNSLDQSFILSAFEDSAGILWVGTDGVLNRIDRHTGKVTFFRHRQGDSNSISSGTVSSTVEDNNGILWFGTWDGGLNRYDRRTGKFRVYRHNATDPHSASRDSIHKLFLDPSGILWIATSSGLDRFDPNSARFTFYPIDPDDPPTVRAVAEDHSGAIWAGTFDRGLYRLDPQKTSAVRHFTSSSGSSLNLSDNRINALLADSAGKIWVGTQNGLNELDPDTQSVVATYTEKDALSNNAVEGILQDQFGRLWISTIRGLTRFDFKTKESRHYYATDGLAGDEFNYFGAAFRAQDGEMFFGGVKGLTAFYPERVIENSSVPPVVLTDFRLFNSSVSPGPHSPLRQSISIAKSLTLYHKQSIFSFEFSALSFADPQRNRYRYRLDGLEKNWNETNSNRRFVTYTTIPAGRYVFRVQGSNNRGVWNEAGVALDIHVLPAWWRTWWFIAIEAVFVMGIFFAIYHVRTRAIKRRNRILRYYGDIFNSTGDGIIAVTFDGVVTSWNRGAERIFGYTAQEMIGQRVSVLAPEGRKEEGLATLSRLAKGEATIRGEALRVRKDGSSIHVSVTASPIHDEKGSLIGASVIVSDISARKQAEEEIKALSENLINAQEQERTRISRELHDHFNQQIVGISLSLGNIRRKLPSRASETSKQLEDVCEDLNSLSKNLREFSHELHPAVLDFCDLSAALRSYCAEFSVLNRLVAEFKDEGHFDDVPPPTALCIYRVAQEALQNVARHSKSDSARVTLARAQDSIHLSVVDNGVGFSLDESHASGGLGIVSMKERVRLVKGVLHIESQPHSGTTLQVTVPVGNGKATPNRS